eukprot:11089-Pelagomonas_calceolata.AAC.14
MCAGSACLCVLIARVGGAGGRMEPSFGRWERLRDGQTGSFALVDGGVSERSEAFLRGREVER